MASHHLQPHINGVSPPLSLQQHKSLGLPLLFPCRSRSYQVHKSLGFGRIRVSDGESYLDMWSKAIDREKKENEFQKIAENNNNVISVVDDEKGSDPIVLEKKSEEFGKLLEVPKEERDRVQRMQVIDRASAAIAAAKALIKERDDKVEEGNGALVGEDKGTQAKDVSVAKSVSVGRETPGPDFWSWTPPTDDITDPNNTLQPLKKTSPSPKPAKPVKVKERSLDYLTLPFESTSVESHNPPLPPLQSLIGEKVDTQPHILDQKDELGVQFSVNANEAMEALHAVEEDLTEGVKPDGSKWWKETGVEVRTDGVVCHWTLIRGVSADKSLEWEEKFWEAADDLEYKELGSEKSGRDATGNVWREYWKESMWQDEATGLINMEKSADKWGKNGKGDEWHEKWWEQYDASGKADKWAHKWCSIDPNTPLDAGHAHVWHEKWGEKYDGQGSSIKYTDKWAERLEGDGWTKWGDKWDENFNQYGQGVKQGESWWQGKYGEKWNRTWGEGHNGSGWIHKYGKSSCGEHWDTHIEQDTWYERFPHFGFHHCFENSRQLREVRKPEME
ncbi:hypothetical protein ACHQM5_014651 [Ranunculus cassubicifolius]